MKTIRKHILDDYDALVIEKIFLCNQSNKDLFLRSVICWCVCSFNNEENYEISFLFLLFFLPFIFMYIFFNELYFSFMKQNYNNLLFFLFLI